VQTIPTRSAAKALTVRGRVGEAFEQSIKPGRKAVNIEDFEDKSEGDGRKEKRVCRVIIPKKDEKLKVNILSK
jgi:hypothetical protein